VDDPDDTPAPDLEEHLAGLVDLQVIAAGQEGARRPRGEQGLPDLRPGDAVAREPRDLLEA
jgi:hypothetical protein